MEIQIKQFNFDPAHVKSWAEEGKKAGEFAQSVFKASESAVMEMLLAFAAVIAGTPSMEDWLTAYAKTWTNGDTGKSRKTDARAVLEAYALKDKDGKPLPVELTVGYEKNPDGSDKLDERKLRIPIKVTQTAPEWLKTYKIGNGEGEGDFKGFLSLARNLRNQGTGNSRASQGTAVSRKKSVTENQFSGIMEQLPVMNAAQSVATVHEGLKHIAAFGAGSEIMLVNSMELTCNMLKSSKNVHCQEAAAEIIDILNTLRDKLAFDQKQRDQAAVNTRPADALHAPSGKAQGDIQAPTPAVQKTGTQG